MDERVRNLYARWRERAAADADLGKELEELSSDEEALEDAFYRDLSFGTGGLRGILGAGTNRMNVYTVARASQGLAGYLSARFENPAVVIGYDSRIKSELFAKTAAGVFAANGVRVRLWPELVPVPMVSFAVRRLRASAGVMITASHNPAKYNGYKVYGADGCQITEAAAAEISARIGETDIFDDVRQAPFEEGVRSGAVSFIPDEVTAAFLDAVKGTSVLYGAGADRDVKIVYTPLNGAGRGPVPRVLREAGFADVSVVPEQERPDGNFPTCPCPNPELFEAMAPGIGYAKSLGADILLATDPDCDRAGIAVPGGRGDYVLLTGNETGLLLFDYICGRRTAAGTMPEDPVMVKTIVTSDLAEKIAARYGVRVVNVLTGFKYIGEQIGRLEREGCAERFVFGFEESCGYLSGAYVRDKDGVGAAMMICEMLAFYKARGITLTERLNAIYAEYGYCLNTLHSYRFEGAEGSKTMRKIMAGLRKGMKDLDPEYVVAPGFSDSRCADGMKYIGPERVPPDSPASRSTNEMKYIGPKRVLSTLDYLDGLDGLPKSDVLKFVLEDGCSAVVRPSGTEPKLKVYICVVAESREEAERAERQLADDWSDNFLQPDRAV